MIRLKYLIYFVCVFLNTLGCAQDKLDLALKTLIDYSVDTVSVQRLASDLKSNPKVYLLDTREKQEFETSHIEGATWVGYENFTAGSVVHIPKDAKVVTYCSVGYRSEKIAGRLKKMGYSNVQNLYGGIFAWKNSEKTVVNKHNQPTDSVHTYNKAWSIFLEEGIKVYE